MRTYKRRTDRGSTRPEVILQAVKAVRKHGKSIRNTAKDFDIPFRSLTRYCKKATEDDIEGTARTLSFNTGYIRIRQVSSVIYFRICFYSF
jgi:hypothetical protein